MKTNNKQTNKEYLESKTDKEWNDYIDSWSPGDSGKVINERRKMYLDAHFSAKKPSILNDLTISI